MKKLIVLLLLGLLSLFQTQAQDTVRMTLEAKPFCRWGCWIEVSPSTSRVYVDWGDDYFGDYEVLSGRAWWIGVGFENTNTETHEVKLWTDPGGNFTYFNAEGNDLGTLTSLDVSGCTALTNLDCSNNQLSTLDVSGYAALKVLDCHGNQLTSLNVSGCTALDSLDCSYNKLTGLDVRNCTELKWLSCNNNPLTSLAVNGCNKLNSVNASRCTSLSSLDFLRMDISSLTSLDVSFCTALRELTCQNNKLTSLNVSGCTALEELFCGFNQLDRLDVSGFTKLKTLACHEIYLLTTLNVSGCESLVYLSCSYNQLTSLDVRTCTALDYLDCSDNQLKSLNVSGCAKLSNLTCYNNQLTSLNVSGCTALDRLDCENNQLRSLDLSGNAQCQWVQCVDNHIPLSSLYPLMARRTTRTFYRFSPQSDTVSLEGGEVFDLSGEMQIGTSATKWSVHKFDGSAVASGTFVENNGRFRFLKKGDYRLTLQNDVVRQQDKIWTMDSSAVVFTWVVKVLSTPPPPKQDTILMKVVGTSAEFSFTADKNAMYCVDWGDGSEEKQACTAGEEKNLTHTYTDSNAYDITFFVYEEPEPTDYTEPFPGIDMVWVKGGTFMMGCTSEQGSDCYPFENPVHEVTLSSYYIGRYEITQAQWKAVMGTDPGFFKGDDLPVEQVSWNEAKEFCDKLSQQTGKQYALPTEAQWEFAARGGTKSKGYRYSGSNTVGDVAWYVDNSHTTNEVGTKNSNELGIYDMSGNVYEWCADWADAYSSDAVTNPTGPDSGEYEYRIIRGGGWGDYASNSRVSDRAAREPDVRLENIGFRVVMIP